MIFLLPFFLLTSLYAQDLTSSAERSGWKITGRAAEARQLCQNFAKKFPSVNCGTYGKTPEGRELFYLTAGPAKKAPVVWVQAGIHAGEIDGKDAVFWLLRELLEKKDPVLTRVRLVFVPIVNLDGHERFGKFNRPNQIGPEEMGWRVTAQNYNMNRDFAKADAPEMRQLLRLWNKFDPVLSLDLHVTDGAKFVPEVGLIVHPTHEGKLAGLAKDFEAALVKKLEAAGRKPLPFYPTFEEDDKPSSGFARYVSTPRFSQGYWSSRNRLGMLVETHSWKDYATRVRTHHDAVKASLELAATGAPAWVKAERELDAENLAGMNVNLEFKHTDKFREIAFEGYKYELRDSAFSGEKVIRYDTSEKQTWTVPFYEELTPSLTVKAPVKGYYVPVKDANFYREKLSLHGIRFETVKKTLDQEFETFRATKTTFSATPFEGHQTLQVEGEWKKEKHTLSPGSLYVPIAQKSARMVLQLFEPKARDSFLSWGFLNRYFENKEYMEAYVVEDVGVEMLKDENIRREFEKLPKETTADQKREFFYRKHPAWDHRFNLYPVLRL